MLDRFASASQKTSADNVIRVCADNPFVDPTEIDRLVKYFINTDCDYAFNHLDKLGSNYADGFGAEIFSTVLLKKILDEATKANQREHVTLYLWDNLKKFNMHAIKAPAPLAFPELRFDVDTSTDLKYLISLVNTGVNIETSATDIIRIARLKNSPSTFESLVPIVKELDKYLKKLFPLCRSITGKGNRQTLHELQKIIPLKVFEVPTGTKVYDWTIPDEWSIRDAYIANEFGQRIVDFQSNNLHVVNYSEPLNALMKWDQLKSHLHKHTNLPNAIPYRTSYYNRDWGFCVTHSQYIELEKQEGPFTVVIDSKLLPGSLTYGEYLIPGRSTKEILLSCYICHPSMANDSLSGVLLTSFLARYLTTKRDLKWSYRVVFVPETIGAIAYCSLNEKKMKQVDLGLVITTVGGPGKFSYKQSWNSNHFINYLTEKVLEETGNEYNIHPFDIHGSDERQYSSPGFRINCVSICKDKYYEYTQYHSSLDNLQFATAQNIKKTYDVYIKLIEMLENQRIFIRRNPHGEAMLSKHNLYSEIGGKQLPDNKKFRKEDIFLWVLFYTDGRSTESDVALKLGLPEIEITTAYQILLQRELVTLIKDNK